MDMLHVDLWSRGHNVAVDAGSFSYADDEWVRYFDATSTHNTITVDDEQQMILFRRFKHLYPTKAHLVDFDVTHVSGEHFAYERISPGCVHRRSVSLEASSVV